MVDVKFENFEGKRCVKLNGRMYTFLQEARGVREKFWLVRTGQKRVNYEEPIYPSQILFKFNRNSVSCEDWGEIISSLVARHIDVPCVQYYSASLSDEDGNDIGKGVMCGSYKHSSKEVEFSAFSLQSLYKNLTYDNYHGEKVDGLNTVDGFLSAIKGVFGDKVPQEELTSVRNDLLKQAIFDFVLAQTDRHWLNTTFLVCQEDNGQTHIRKSACYDNGCISMFKRKSSAIEGMSREIGSLGKDSPYLKERLSSYCPMMGVKTSLVGIDNQVRQGSIEKIKMLDPKHDKKVFLNELSLQIVNNPEIAHFYINLENMVNDGSLFKYIESDLSRSGDNPPAHIIKMVEDVIGHQVGQLSAEVHRVINLINSDENYDASSFDISKYEGM